MTMAFCLAAYNKEQNHKHILHQCWPDQVSSLWQSVLQWNLNVYTVYAVYVYLVNNKFGKLGHNAQWLAHFSLVNRAI